MRPAATIDELTAEPRRYLRYDKFVMFSIDDSLRGAAIWGRVGEPTMRDILAFLDAHLDRAPTPYRGICDLSRVEWVDPRLYAMALDYFQRRGDELLAVLRRQAILLPAMPRGGLLVAGFVSTTPPPIELQLFDSREEAARYLECPDLELVLAEIDELVDDRRSTRAALLRVLRREFRDTKVQSAAKTLGISPRTLQRRLRDEGTSFQEELDTVRLDAAKDLMLQSDDKLTSIAFAVGCSSLQQFSALFRRLTGEAPTTWRERHKRGV